MRFAPLKAEDRVKARWIPKGALPVEEESKLGVVYVYTRTAQQSPDGKPRFGAVAYSGTSFKSDWHYVYRTDKELDAKIEQYFAGLREHQARVKRYREESFKGHSLVVGDILTYSW